MIYSFFIQPLEILMSGIFDFLVNVSGSYGPSVILLSLTVSIILLPLYVLADRLKTNEKQEKARMAGELANISVYSGAEKHYYVQEIYKRHRYHPLKSLRVALGFLIQVPFFIAAYNFLGHYEAFEGTNFLLIGDLSRPDGLLWGVNLLPFLMTGINLLSAMVFTRGTDRNEKIQLYLVSVLFLVLLYRSASALVLYWTMNNVFSLAKNIVWKFFEDQSLSKVNRSAFLTPLKRHRRIFIFSFFAFLLLTVFVLSVFRLTASGVSYPFLMLREFGMIFCVITAFFLLYFLSVSHSGNRVKFLLLSVVPVLITLFFFAGFQWTAWVYNNLNIKLIKPYLIETKGFIVFGFLIFFLLFLPRLSRFAKETCGKYTPLYYYSAVIISVLIFVYSPSGLLKSSPDITNSYEILIGELVPRSGAVILILFYTAVILPKRILRQTAFTLFFISLTMTVMTFLFPGDYGVLDAFFFEKPQNLVADRFLQLFISVVLSITLTLVYFGWHRLKIARAVMLYTMIFILAVSFYNITSIKNRDADNRPPETAVSGTQFVEPAFQFSRNGENIVILFIDRFINGYVQEAFKDNPGLPDRLDGFIWYPNAVSTASRSVGGLPPVLGGYDYTIGEMNSRKNDLLVEKYNESLHVLPYNLAQKGYSLLLTDLSSANYIWNDQHMPDGTKKAERKDINGLYNSLWLKRNGVNLSQNQLSDRDIANVLSVFGVFRASPPVLREYIYHRGTWSNMYKAKHHSFLNLIRHWSTIDYLDELSSVSDSDENRFMFILNEVTHNGYRMDSSGPTLDPEYSDSEMDRFKNIVSLHHYFPALYSLEEIANWTDWLKENGVYDNTMLIVVSDHGHDVHVPMFGEESDGQNIPYAKFHALLMVKPFNSNDPLEISDEFMTNADVPSMVLDTVGGGINPFNGSPVSVEQKNKPVRLYDIDAIESGKYIYDYNAVYEVHDDIFDPENWSVAE